MGRSALDTFLYLENTHMIEVRNNDDLPSALKKFRREVKRSGLFRELRARRYYEKPSEKRHRERRKIEHERKRRGRRGGKKY